MILASVAKAKRPFHRWGDVVRTVEAVGKVPKARRPKGEPIFKPKKKVGRRRTKPLGRVGKLFMGRELGADGNPIDAPKSGGRKRKAVAYGERPPTQKSLDSGRR